MSRFPKGWTPCHRSVTLDDPDQNPYCGHPLLLAARMTLLNWASRYDTQTLRWGRHIDVRRGDVLCTNESLQRMLSLTEKQVRVVIRNLQKIGFLGTEPGTKKGTRGYHLRITDYEGICADEKGKGTGNGTTTGTERAPRGHRNGQGDKRNKLDKAPAAGSVRCLMQPNPKLTIDGEPA